jgi:hypothetical protein
VTLLCLFFFFCCAFDFVSTGLVTSSASDLSHLNNDAKNHGIAGESFDANLGRQL